MRRAQASAAVVCRSSGVLSPMRTLTSSCNVQLDVGLLDHRLAHALVADVEHRRQSLAEPA